MFETVVLAITAPPVGIRDEVARFETGRTRPGAATIEAGWAAATGDCGSDGRDLLPKVEEEAKSQA